MCTGWGIPVRGPVATTRSGDGRPPRRPGCPPGWKSLLTSEFVPSRPPARRFRSTSAGRIPREPGDGPWGRRGQGVDDGRGRLTDLGLSTCRHRSDGSPHTAGPHVDFGPDLHEGPRSPASTRVMTRMRELSRGILEPHSGWGRPAGRCLAGRSRAAEQEGLTGRARITRSRDSGFPPTRCARHDGGPHRGPASRRTTPVPPQWTTSRGGSGHGVPGGARGAGRCRRVDVAQPAGPAVGAGARRHPARGGRQPAVGLRLRLRGVRPRGGRRPGDRERAHAGARPAAGRDHPGAAAAPGRHPRRGPAAGDHLRQRALQPADAAGRGLPLAAVDALVGRCRRQRRLRRGGRSGGRGRRAGTTPCRCSPASGWRSTTTG